jgi:LysR family transcriptional regulator, glycine cleavage system transcriptional activator
MRIPSLKFLKTFQIVARRLSFKAASEELCLTASAVSHQIRSLEAEFGVELFQRRPQSLQLTDAGAQLLEHVDAAMARLELGAEQLRGRTAHAALRLQVPQFFAAEILIPRLALLRATQPNVEFRISSPPNPSIEHGRDVDVSITVKRNGAADLHCTPLFPQSYVAVCAPDLTELPLLCTATDLNRQSLIVHNHRPDLWARWAEMFGIELLSPRHLIEFDSMTAVVDAAERGAGVALISAPLAARRIAAGTLIRLCEQELSLGESYVAMARPADAGRAQVAALLGWLAQNCHPVAA